MLKLCSFIILFFTQVLDIVQIVFPQYLNRLSNTALLTSVIQNLIKKNFKQTIFYLRNYATKERILLCNLCISLHLNTRQCLHLTSILEQGCILSKVTGLSSQGGQLFDYSKESVEGKLPWNIFLKSIQFPRHVLNHLIRHKFITPPTKKIIIVKNKLYTT